MVILGTQESDECQAGVDFKELRRGGLFMKCERKDFKVAGISIGTVVSVSLK